MNGQVILLSERMTALEAKLRASQEKLDEIVRITDNSPGCDPVAAVRRLWTNAGDMVKELTRLRGEVRTYREMADRRGDMLEHCRAELRAAEFLPVTIRRLNLSGLKSYA